VGTETLHHLLENLVGEKKGVNEEKGGRNEAILVLLEQSNRLAHCDTNTKKEHPAEREPIKPRIKIRKRYRRLPGGVLTPQKKAIHFCREKAWENVASARV